MVISPTPASPAYLRPSRQISPIAPKLPMRLSFIMESRASLSFPPQMPSQVSARPSRCNAPVMVMYATSTSAQTINGGKKAENSTELMDSRTPMHKPATGNQQATAPVRWNPWPFLPLTGITVKKVSAHKKLFILTRTSWKR